MNLVSLQTQHGPFFLGCSATNLLSDAPVVWCPAKLLALKTGWILGSLTNLDSGARILGLGSPRPELGLTNFESLEVPEISMIKRRECFSKKILNCKLKKLSKPQRLYTSVLIDRYVFLRLSKNLM